MNAKAKDPTPPPPPQSKRAKPQPSAETEALRALRQLRQLKERADKAFATYTAVRDECLDASVAIESDLSEEARELVDILRVKEAKLDGSALTPAAPGKDGGA